MASYSRRSAHKTDRFDGIAMPIPIRPGQIMLLDSLLNFDPVPAEELEGAVIGPLPTPSTLRPVDEAASDASSDGGVPLGSESPVTVPCLDGAALPTGSAPTPAPASGAATFRLNPEVAAFVPQAASTSLPSSSGTRRMLNVNPESASFVPLALQAPASNPTADTFLPADDDAAHTDCSCCDGFYPGTTGKQIPDPIDTPPTPTVDPLVTDITPANPPPGDQLDITPPLQPQHSINIGFPYAGGHNIPTRPLSPPPDLDVRRNTLVTHTIALLHARGLNWTRVQSCIRTPLNDPASRPRPTILITMGLLHVDREALARAFREILLFAEQELELPAINVKAVDTLYAGTDNELNHNTNDENDDDDCVLPDFDQSLLAEVFRLTNTDVYLPPPFVWVNFVRGCTRLAR
ncbi:hypothetical protein ASPCAL13956 [Aspergillus calidoustus]|uniref:Uncharacterized protein n=1 Tax=Aspergillus calidoustus TaxID=454130 RepID=A0A0U5GLP1_ASPCI|nr:hypothetical protein ASPCAL13956 [Aspergillus calidoustus]